MESLIDVILGNLWLVIIVIGVISSMFGKKRSPDQQPQNSPRSAVPSAETRGQPKRMTMKEVYRQAVQEIEKQLDPSGGAEGSKTEIQEAASKAEAAAERAEEQRKTFEKKRKQAEAARTQQLSRPAIGDEDSPIYVKDLQVSRERLAEGMILSEILGPPRSKKPHRSRRY